MNRVPTEKSGFGRRRLEEPISFLPASSHLLENPFFNFKMTHPYNRHCGGA